MKLIFIRLLVVFILFQNIPLIVQAKEIKYNHDSITISEIKRKVDFKVVVPQNIPNDWTLEIKTYPWDEKDKITNFSLHYMDSDDKYMLIHIGQSKESSNKEMNINAEQVDINGNKGFFVKWGNSGELDKKGELVTGGLLRWIQEGTYVEMESSRVSRNKMLEVARSMK
ncbi:DUF4367 domain-containing protein [Peribacillus frigoritolerans]|uniref:DUF4367 domain-containing protein n=1 Tax=Peribacillus frigoritolerans TaxID=450367 RepID=UPI00207A7214|nr:DUF4367 domain-containing protein [Peribacillus frigoritolerans]USK80747.1 DUF4367 domain-containing protein [Peribacillus frigoritolerans]WJE48019.1 DUF4367 domain-containing protein [Peribacillus frigoritolerans]